MTKRVFASFIICFSCSILFSCTKDSAKGTAPPPEPVSGKTYSADEVTAFKQMTLKNTFNRIIKWQKKVFFYIVHTNYPYMTQEVDNILDEINQLLGSNLVVERTNDWNAADISIFLTDRATYITAEPDTKGSLENSAYTGLAHLKWDQGIISRGSVFVDMIKTAGDTVQQRYLIHHEIMHALGFYGHTSSPSAYTVLYHYTLMPYILNYTTFDKRMMLLLYNPAIRANMNETAFDEAVKAL